MSRLFWSVAWLAFGPVWLAAQTPETIRPAEPAAKDAAPAWSIQTYRFPAEDLGEGFVSPERGQMHAPALPPANAKEAEVDEFLRQSSEATKEFLKIQGVFAPEGSFFVYDPKNWTLVARTDALTQEQLSALAASARRHLPQNVSLELDLYEVSAEVALALADEAAAQADHTALRARAEGLIGKGQAKLLEEHHVIAYPGQQVALGGTQQHRQVSRVLQDVRNWLDVRTEERPIDMRFAATVTTDSVGKKIRLDYTMQYPYAAPTVTREKGPEHTTPTVTLPLTTYHSATVKGSETVLAGMTKLLSVWKPEGLGHAERPGVWQMAFLKGDLPLAMPRLNPRVEQMLRARAEVISPQAAAEKQRPQTHLPKGMILRTFLVPEDFLSKAAKVTEEPPPAVVAGGNAFGGGAVRSEPRVSVQMTATDVLRTAGIEFPPGSSANYNGATSQLLVRNTLANIKQLEALIRRLSASREYVLGYRLHIFEADGATVRRLARQGDGLGDHTDALEALEQAAKAGKAKVLANLWAEGPSGAKLSYWCGDQITDVGLPEIKRLDPPSAGSGANSAKGDGAGINWVRSLETSTRWSGIQWEAHGVLDSNLHEIALSSDLTYQLPAPGGPAPAPAADAGNHAAKPESLLERTKAIDSNAPGVVEVPPDAPRRAAVSLSSKIQVGMTQMMGLWQPQTAPGAPASDTLQVAFITVDLIPVEFPEGK